MDIQEQDLIVLARIPDLGNHHQQHHHDGNSDGTDARRKLSGSRWISQTLSFKLLAGLTLCLLVAAVLPYVLSQSPAPAGSPVTNDSLGGWRSDAANDFGDEKAGSRPTPKEATLVRAAPDSPPPQRIAERQSPAGDTQPKPSNETPTWSKWPNPHPVEYEADARGDGKSQESRRDSGKH
jgi:hypothetical protein